MSRISSREKKLLFLILALLFVFSNVYALKWWRQEMDVVTKEQRQLERALIEDEACMKSVQSGRINKLGWTRLFKPFPEGKRRMQSY